MQYEKEYINYVISEVINFPEIETILEGYLMNEIDFNGLVKSIEENVDIYSYRIFKKSIDIDNLLG